MAWTKKKSCEVKLRKQTARKRCRSKVAQSKRVKKVQVKVTWRSAQGGMHVKKGQVDDVLKHVRGWNHVLNWEKREKQPSTLAVRKYGCRDASHEWQGCKLKQTLDWVMNKKTGFDQTEIIEKVWIKETKQVTLWITVHATWLTQ